MALLAGNSIKEKVKNKLKRKKPGEDGYDSRPWHKRIF